MLASDVPLVGSPGAVDVVASVTPDAANDELATLLAALPEQLGLARDFPPAVLAEADAAAKAAPLPDCPTAPTSSSSRSIRPVRTTSTRRFQLVREGAGYRFWYAIADVPAFVAPGRRDRRRGAQARADDLRRRRPHPAASPGAQRGSRLAAARPVARRIRVGVRARRERERHAARRSRAAGCAVVDASTTRASSSSSTPAPPTRRSQLLTEVGSARLALERARGGASLNMPEVLIDKVDGRYAATRRTQLPVEDWNAELSLLTGMEAATIMLDGQGRHPAHHAARGPEADRPLPSPDPRARHTRGRPTQPYGDYLAALDGTNPQHLAILHAAASLFRGAGYTPFDGEPPATTIQAAVGAPYAHVTAPLRRLVDRFGLVICEALAAGDRRCPDWARAALPELPAEMARSNNLAGQLDRRALDAVEAAVLAPRVGETFDGVIIAQNKSGSVVQLLDPAVTAECSGASGDRRGR